MYLQSVSLKSSVMYPYYQLVMLKDLFCDDTFKLVIFYTLSRFEIILLDSAYKLILGIVLDKETDTNNTIINPEIIDYLAIISANYYRLK